LEIFGLNFLRLNSVTCKQFLFISPVFDRINFEHYLFLRDFQIPSDVIKCSTAKHTKSEKLRNDLSVITNF